MTPEINIKSFLENQINDSKRIINFFKMTPFELTCTYNYHTFILKEFDFFIRQTILQKSIFWLLIWYRLSFIQDDEYRSYYWIITDFKNKYVSEYTLTFKNKFFKKLKWKDYKLSKVEEVFLYKIFFWEEKYNEITERKLRKYFEQFIKLRAEILITKIKKKWIKIKKNDNIRSKLNKIIEEEIFSKESFQKKILDLVSRITDIFNKLWFYDETLENKYFKTSKLYKFKVPFKSIYSFLVSYYSGRFSKYILSNITNLFKNPKYWRLVLKIETSFWGNLLSKIDLKDINYFTNNWRVLIQYLSLSRIKKQLSSSLYGALFKDFSDSRVSGSNKFKKDIVNKSYFFDFKDETELIKTNKILNGFIVNHRINKNTYKFNEEIFKVLSFYEYILVNLNNEKFSEIIYNYFLESDYTRCWELRRAYNIFEEKYNKSKKGS